MRVSGEQEEVANESHQTRGSCKREEAANELHQMREKWKTRKQQMSCID